MTRKCHVPFCRAVEGATLSLTLIRINHKAILDRVTAPEFIIGGLRQCLKAGINPKFPYQGTPQGGVVSPLLANIALNGIERIGEFKKWGYMNYKCIRYADDMVFILKPEDDAEEILTKVEGFLAERGMEVSKKKTKITASTDGFNFLGWHFYVQKNNEKFRSTPSVDNFKAFREKVKHIVNNSNYGAETKVMKLALIRGWRNYHKHCKMDGSRFGLWNMNHKTFKVFLKNKSINRHKAMNMVKKAFPAISCSENKFVMVKGDKSPFDGDINYWAKRNSKYYDGATKDLLSKQSRSCGHCGLKLLDEEKVELHHIDGNHNNWNNNNLIAVHRSCHHYVHMGKSRKD